MKDYTNYTVEDLLTDDRFVSYCLRNNESNIRYWERILNSNPQLAERVREAKSLVLLMSVKVDDEQKRVELGRLKEAMEVRWLPRPVLRWLAIAASLVLVGSACLFLMRNRTVDRAIAFALEQAKPAPMMQTALGERRHITLPDGSTVLLNGASRLSAVNGFNDTHRVVWLEGDAYFDVSKDADKPFIVRTATTVTTALGTTFRVRNYPNEQEPRIMLTSGKVQVDHVVRGKSFATTVLLPGQTAIIDGQHLLRSSFAPDEMETWLNSRLIFRGADFSEIKDKLYDMYGVLVVADKDLANTVAFTGQFANRQLHEVLDAIAFSNHVRFAVDGNTIQMIPLAK
ncbi:FecR family protein [Parapedobacter deserti]|uniref:FecR family protein n=1 Tax=Parapedobacter deserti TaxID=1912957 RepID=A0ABV7JPB5_9SPHI